MAEDRIDAETRTSSARVRPAAPGASRSPPCCTGTAPTRSTCRCRREFARVIREQGRNAVVTLNVAGRPQLALTKTVVTHPIVPTSSTWTCSSCSAARR